MKNKKRSILALMAATAVLTVSTASMTSSAVTTVRDAKGDGKIYLNDVITTSFYLSGMYNPSSVKSFDFDGNGIISAMDSLKIQHYLLHNISESGLPGPAGADSQAVATTRQYFRHNCSDTNKRSKTEYSLTVNPYDNTSSSTTNDEPVPYSIIGADNRVNADDDTAIVKLVDPTTGNGIASGFIVDDHVIATAVHCVYTGLEFRDLSIRIIDENNNLIKTVSPKYIHVPKEAIYNTNSIRGTHDYALLYVEEDLSEYGAFQLGVATDEYIDNHGSVVVSGFPGDLPENYTGQSGDIRFKASGNFYRSSVSPYNNYRCFYDADAVGGNSGGPVYVEEGFKVGDQWYKYKTVVAIHSGGCASFSLNYNYFDPEYNSGVTITPDILNFYYSNSYLTE